ncbi:MULTISPECIES: AMP-binding protein [unclassified Variovorax]|uniref:AMP-binding protein n=1 Tax=unclassified Variovorax TaxID=663243 RepID=UPI0008C5745B|nr:MULTISPECIES: AMP-binding protein [unclassified Variovorax]SEK13157.1 fatty-acyl-CoA synthase [Variovorax sp. OK202]SFD87332.1 fatty-acyl-CoA synthase [Variovorax sp. OK212]
MPTKYDTGLDKCQANHQPLTVLRFLDRAADVFPDRTAVIHGDLRYSWAEHADRCRRLARALIGAGVQRGDTVAIIASNIPAMLEAQFGVPMSGAVLNCINVRLEPAAMAFILMHSDARVLLVDQMFADVAREAVKQSGMQIDVIDIRGDDVPEADRVGLVDYEDFLRDAPANAELRYPRDEWDAIALNYTSGTTGNPKGVVYHHRGAYLNALGQVIYAELSNGQIPVYLWTLPLFHCNGWCYAWAMAAVAGTHVCLRKVVPEDIYAAVERHGVTYFCGAPTVLGSLVAGKPADWQPPAGPITIACAGASPPVSIIRATQALGFRVQHVYGMTEQHGVNTVCVPQESWSKLSADEQSALMGRQGVRTAVSDEMIVADPTTFKPVPRDGITMGEVLFRGNLGMKGYLKNADATQEAFAGGWHHSGDLAVVHENGYIEIKDRSKDIIISGGENVSSLEVEEVLYTHPAVLNAAVVAIPDEKWGEVVCAVLELRPEAVGSLTQDDVIKYCRARLAGFKSPRHVIFEPIVRTATGKLQKFKLRAHAAGVIVARNG